MVCFSRKIANIIENFSPMKKTLPLLLMLVSMFTASLYAQCTMDTAPTTPGLYPDTLAWACENEPYDETITLVFANDTSISVPPLPPLSVNFLSYKITNIQNLPAGITYVCDNANCEWTIVQSQVNRGCVRFSGTATAAFTGDIIVTVEATVDNPLVPATPVDVPTPFTVQSVADCNTSTARTGLSYSASKLSLFPNPGSSVFYINGDVSAYQYVEVIDVSGKKLYTMPIENLRGNSSIQVQAQGWNPGLYLVKLLGSNRVETLRWVLQ